MHWPPFQELGGQGIAPAGAGSGAVSTEAPAGSSPAALTSPPHLQQGWCSLLSSSLLKGGLSPI